MRVTVIPALSREESLDYWDLSASHHWEELDDLDDVLEEGMHVERSGSPSRERQANGGTSHRGVLHPDEYVNGKLLRRFVGLKLGFTMDEVACAYAEGRKGRPAAACLGLRERIDARLLELSNRGGNMTALARVFGWSVREDGECRTMAAALRRARTVSQAVSG